MGKKIKESYQQQEGIYTFLINALEFRNMTKVTASYFKPPTVTPLLRSVTHGAHGKGLR